MPLYPHILTTILAITRFRGIAARYDGFRHKAQDASRNELEKRDNPFVVNFTITEQCPTASPTRSIHSIIFPSPDASPVEITTQSQVITSFLPDMTYCAGHPMAMMPISGIYGPPYLNDSTQYGVMTAGTGTGHCETLYATTLTTVCATTLTAMASKITVSECDQEITFSSESGFTLETPTPVMTTNYSMITPAPTLKKMVTYWLAPWQSLTAGDTPSDVDIKICTIQDDGNMKCVRYQEVWEVVVVTQTLTTSREVTLTTTFSGPGTLVVETMTVYITDTIQTVDLSTTMLLETEVEIESTSKGKKLVTRSEIDGETPTSTVYITKHLKYRTSAPEPTTTVRITSTATQIVGTITRTRARARTLPTFLDLPDF